MKKELSTGCALSTASLKKREGEKRMSPLTPYREKSKGKEDKPSACSTGLFARAHADAHVRGALLRRHVNAAVEDALAAFCGSRGPAPSDEALWAKFAWRFGYGMLHELTERGKSEMRMHKGGVAPAERPRILQNLLNEVWFGRYAKKGPAAALRASASALRAAADKMARQGGAA